MKAIIALEDGAIFEGNSFGAQGEKAGEVVFNTSMMGYQEILTDPSYKGQIVAMTYPLIGNYGINSEDVESRDIFLEGFVVKECSRIASNWRSQKSLDAYLKENDVMGVEGIDTRALTRHIRLSGEMKAVISTENLDKASLVRKAKESPGLIGRDLVKEVTCRETYVWPQLPDASCPPTSWPSPSPRLGETGRRAGQLPEKRFKVVVIDGGVKFNILRELDKHGCQVIVVPARTTAEQILKMKPHGVVLCNGPGDPAGVPYVVETAKGLINPSSYPSAHRQEGKGEGIPIMGICLGHQMLGLAFGGKTYKLKFGHHGANHPVKDLRTGKISITVQNHGFCVDIESLDKRDIEITHINLNDNTLEGMRHKRLPIFSVQFHPEASAGPHDAEYLFGEFVGAMEQSKQKGSRGM